MNTPAPGSVTAPAAGWYPDPLGRHQHRYWDGAAWSPHVADHGVAATDPLPAGAPAVHQVAGSARPAHDDPDAPAARPAAAGYLVDLEVSSGVFGKKPLRLDDETLQWGDDRVALADVEAVAYCVTRTTYNGVPSGTNYSFFVWSHGRQTKVVLSTALVRSKAARDAYAEAFTTLANTFARLVEPRLRQALAERVARGETVEVAGTRLSSRGIEKNVPLRGTKSVTWDRLAGAGFHQGMVVVHGARDGARQSKAAFTVAMTEPNAVLLPDLIHQLAGGVRGS